MSKDDPIKNNQFKKEFQAIQKEGQKVHEIEAQLQKRF